MCFPCGERPSPRPPPSPPVSSNVLVDADFVGRFALGPWQEGLLTSVLELFALAGSLTSAYVLAPLSPHRPLVVFALVFVPGSGLQTFASSAAVLTVGRAIGGVRVRPFQPFPPFSPPFLSLPAMPSLVGRERG